eukprot:g5854.t1
MTMGSVEKFCRWIQLDPYVFFVKTVHSRQGKGQCFLKPGAARYTDEKNAAEWVQICRKEFGSRKLIFQRPAVFLQGLLQMRGRDEGAMKEIKGANEKRHMPGLVYTGNAQRTNRTRGTNAQSSGPLIRLLLEFKTRCPPNVAILFGKQDYAELSVGSQLLQKVHSMALQEEQTSMGPSSSSAALHGIWGRYGGSEMGLGARLAAAVDVILSSRPTSSAPPRPQSQSRELELTERCHELADTLARGSKAWKKTIAGDPVKELEVQAKVREAFCPEAERPEGSGVSALHRATRLDDVTDLVKSFVLDDDDETVGSEAAAAANKTSRGSVLYSGWVYAAWSYYEQVQCSVRDGAGAGASAPPRWMDDIERSVGARLFGSLCENEDANAACDIDAVRERSKLPGRIYARLFRDVGKGSAAPGASDERQNDTSGTMGSYRGQLCELFQKGQHVFYHSGTRTLIFHAKPFVETEIASASKASTLVRIAKTVLGQVPMTSALVSSSSPTEEEGDRKAMRALRSRQITDEEELKRWRHNPGVDGTFKNLAKEYTIAVNRFAAGALRKELGAVQQELLDTEQTAQTEAEKPGVVPKSEAEGASGSAGGAAGASISNISLEHVLFDSDSASWPWVPAVATSAAAIPIDGHPQFLAPKSRSTDVEQKLVLPEAARAVLRETDRLIYAHNYDLQDSSSFTDVIATATGAVPVYRIATTENIGTEDEMLCAAGAQANGDDAHAQKYHQARTTTSASSKDLPVLVVQSAVAQTAGAEDSPAANVCAIWVDQDSFDPSAQGELRVHGLATLREVGPRRGGTTASQNSNSSFEFAYAVAATGGGDSCLRLASDLEFYVYDEMQKKRHAFLVGGDKVSVLSMEKNLALLPKGPVHELRSSLGVEGDVVGAKPSKMLWTSVAKTGAVLGEVAVHLSDLTEFAAEEEELGLGARASAAGIDLDAEGGRGPQNRKMAGPRSRSTGMMAMKTKMVTERWHDRDRPTKRTSERGRHQASPGREARRPPLQLQACRTIPHTRTTGPRRDEAVIWGHYSPRATVSQDHTTLHRSPPSRGGHTTTSRFTRFRSYRGHAVLGMGDRTNDRRRRLDRRGFHPGSRDASHRRRGVVENIAGRRRRFSGRESARAINRRRQQ